jgi:hypothetical protein
MNNQQLYLAIGVPIVVNLTALGIVASILMHHITAMATSLRLEFGARFESLAGETNRRFGTIENRLSAIESDLKDFYKAQAEFDKRLSRIEERLNK